MVTNCAEPGDIETLDLQVQRPGELSMVEYIRIAVIEEDVRASGVASLVMSQFRRAPPEMRYCQSHITAAEIDEIIAALQEAKRRMGAALGKV